MAGKRAPRLCMEAGCSRPCWGNKRRCYWHFLLEQPIEVQERAADLRLAKTPPESRRARVPPKEWPDGARWCSGCQWMVPLFYTRGSRCVACASRASHRGATSSQYRWPPGVTYDSLLALQGGRCAICRKVPRQRRLAVDHDHQTGWVRGLLCSGERGCNHGLLGAANDDVQILRNAVYYLEHPPAMAGTHGDG